MIEIVPTPDQIRQAEEKAKEMGVLKHSFMQGERNAIGFLGEILFADLTGGRIENTYDYDIVLNGEHIDVKSKSCTMRPQDSYFCSVPAYQRFQKCDRYAFVRILKNFQRAWILGTYSKADMFLKSAFFKAGEQDPTYRKEFLFKIDSFNVKIADLEPVKKGNDHGHA